MDSNAYRLRALAGPLVFFISVSLLAGCYTTFMHPGTPDLTQEEVSRDRSCYDCHEEAEFYHSYYGVYFDYYASPWFGYYSDPWWFRSDWYHGGTTAPEPLDSDTRRVWGRGAPSGSARGAQGSTTGPAYLKPGYSKTPSSKPAKPQEAEKKTEEKESRRPYKRGKKK